MKKKLAAILAVATVLGCVGCSKSEETTKKKKKTTKKTTAEETEETDEPSDSETEGPSDESSETSAVTDTSQSETSVEKAQLVVTHDAHRVENRLQRTFLQYGAIDPNADTDYGVRLNTVTLDADLPLMFLKNVPDMLDSLRMEYDRRAENFYELEKAGAELTDYSDRISTYICRSDDEIVSFVLAQSLTDPVTGNLESQMSMNFYYEDGQFIYQFHVILDNEALKAYLTEHYDKHYVLDDTFTAIDENRLEFGILYDGIYIPSIDAKVPFLGNEQFLNPEYFGKTPDYYSMLLDAEGKLTWDFDGDEQMEDLSVTQTAPTELTISYKGKDISFDTKNVPDFDEFYVMPQAQYVVFSDEGTYLLFSVNSDEDDSHYFLVFRLEKDLWVYKSVYDAAITDASNPYEIVLDGYEEVLGICGTRVYGSFMEGMFIPNTEYQEVFSGPYQVKEDLSGETYDYLSGEPKGEEVIPKGAKISICWYWPNEEKIVVKVLDPDENKTHYVLLKVDGTKIAGMSTQEALEGVIYAG